MQGKNAVVPAVLGMVNAVNRVDFATAVGAFTDSAVIIEDIPQYIWRGADAPADWLSAMGANAARLNAQSVLMTFGQPTRVEVNEEAAYAVFPGQLRLVAREANLVAQRISPFSSLRALCDSTNCVTIRKRLSMSY